MYQKRMFNVKCTNCGKSTTVPFEPKEGKPVYCKICFAKQRITHQEKPNVNMFNMKNVWAIQRDDWQGRKEKKRHDIFRTI